VADLRLVALGEGRVRRDAGGGEGRGRLGANACQLREVVGGRRCDGNGGGRGFGLGRRRGGGGVVRGFGGGGFFRRDGLLDVDP
jgi:hypothetical protein